jgi:hypothetical protein
MNPRHLITNTVGLWGDRSIQMGKFSLSIQIEIKNTAIGWVILSIVVARFLWGDDGMSMDKFVRTAAF